MTTWATLVLRGETIDDLANGKLGSYNSRYSACIGGRIWNDFQGENEKSIDLKRYQIGVEEVEGRQVLEVFSLVEIYHEILDERDYGKQVTLDL